MRPIELIVDRQINRWELERRGSQEVVEEAPRPGPIITISRQRGSGGSLVATKLAELTGFSHVNREFIDQISHEIGTQKRLVESLDESKRSGFQLWVDGIIGGRIIDTSDYMHSLVKIIGAVTHHGKAILVGRGANFIARGDNAFHVRIVADLEFRINTLIKRRNLTSEQADHEIAENDRQRKKFIESCFNRNIDDLTAYDMVINSTHLDVDKVANMILNAFPQKFANSD
ncbi:MAG: cytidylate kinase-like family protein [candidate division Zixibacteria bacterium]|nr:cytidylate kinase-like family protein [candidate division Zixibacteria bacterium]